MSIISNSSIHDILDKTDWDYDELKKCLEEDPSSMSEWDINRNAFHRVLMDSNRSLDIIRLFIHHGADVNLDFGNGYSPLQMLMYRNEDEAIIKVLLEGGADMNKLTTHGQSLLCLAISHCDAKTVLMLIEAGCPLHTCLLHESTIVCFTEPLMCKYLNTDVLKLLIKKCRGVDLNVVNSFGRSLLCYAISQFPGFDVFNFMLESGCSLNACQCHGSPWLCLTSSSHVHLTVHLTKDLVQMLFDIDPGTNVANDINEDLLNCALKYCSYDMSAIQLMFDKEIVHLEGTSLYGENALHAAVSNLDVTVSPNIVHFLVNRGADIHAVDDEGNTPLHLAMTSYTSSNLNAIEALLKNGALVNAANAIGETPLKIVIKMDKCDHVVLQLLLNAGARIGPDKWTFETLSYALEEYIGFSNKNDCCKLLIKYSLLDNPSIDTSLLISKFNYRDIADFVNVCSDELQRMETISVSRHCTLYQLIDNSSQQEVDAEDYKPPTFNQLINVLIHNKFPTYFNVICARFDREDMNPKLQEIVWLAKTDPETHMNKKIVLNYDSVFKITSYLSDEELLKLIICSEISEI